MDEDGILALAKKLAKKAGSLKRQRPFNVFSEWGMSENDHTKLLLALLRYSDAHGFSVLQSFLTRFARGRDKMIHYKHPSVVSIRFSPRYGTEKHSFADGLVIMEPEASALHLS